MTKLLKDKKILVAGGAGFVGTNLIQRLLAEGIGDIRATIYRKSPQIVDKRIDYIKCDLTNAEDCARAVQGIDFVFMCAANTSGAGVMAKTPLVHVTPNILMNTLMLDAAYGAGVKKFLWLSSNTVYPALDYPVKEEDMVPGNIFEKYYCVAWMKQFSEILCRMYAEKIRNPMGVVVVRPANIYGAYDDFEWETSHVIPALIRKVVERHKPIEVWGDGKDIKDLIYIDDFIDGMLLAMDKIDTFDPVNIGTGRPATVREAINYMIELDDYLDAEIVFDSSKPTMIPVRLIDVSKAKRLLGFEAKVSFSDGLARTIKWYRKARQLIK